MKMKITMGNRGWQGKRAIWVTSLIIGVILTNSGIVEFPHVLHAPGQGKAMSTRQV
jgi:hypothetical protein